MATSFEAYDPEVKPPYIRRKYPRLRDGESTILAQYLEETNPDSVERLRTAVPVGEGEVSGEPQTQFQRQAKALSQWKIDAVVDRPSSQEVIELKSRATHTAVGQVLAYDIALGERVDEPTESKRVVAAFRLHPDLREYASLVNVRTHTVPDADPSGATRRFRRDLERFRS